MNLKLCGWYGFVEMKMKLRCIVAHEKLATINRTILNIKLVQVNIEQAFG